MGDFSARAKRAPTDLNTTKIRAQSLNEPSTWQAQTTPLWEQVNLLKQGSASTRSFPRYDTRGFCDMTFLRIKCQPTSRAQPKETQLKMKKDSHRRHG